MFKNNLLQPNKKCIINTDLDGVLTGTLVQNILNWEIVGLCDSKDSIWIESKHIQNINDIIFLDIYVSNKNLKCIDQHIVAKDITHAKEISNNPNKQNPNLDRIRYASSNMSDTNSYAWKYPFGTFHYILACLENLKHDIKIPKNNSFYSINTYDVILRADDAARSTTKHYRKNTLDWWGWLNSFGGKQTKLISTYCSELNFDHAQNCYDKLGSIFRKSHSCHTSDGNFSKKLKLNNGEIDQYMQLYFDAIANSLEMDTLNIPMDLTTIKGEFLLEATYNTVAVEKILEREDLFSYAYTYCMGRLAAKGFSYTLMPPKGIPK